MSENKRMVGLIMRSKLLTEPDGPYANHTGQWAMPTVDQDGNVWVVLAVGDGSGTGGGSFALEAGYDSLDTEANFTQAGSQQTGLAVVNHPYLFNGNAATPRWARAGNASVDNIALLTGLRAAMVTGVGEWAIQHSPVAATQATISRAVVAGVRHVCKGVSFTFNAINAEAGTFLVNLRDGASGAGTILQSWRVGPFAAGASMIFSYTDLNIPGSVGTAMTLEFATAPAAGNFEAVNLRGYDAS